jgi:hypothetical protein
MSRYDAKSVEFGEELKREREEQTRQRIKDEESFAKKIAGTSFVVKGLNSVLNDRMARFNSSLADEKAYLTTQQGLATKFLNTHNTNVVDKNLSVKDYLDQLNKDSFRDIVENDTKGVKQQRMIDGVVRDVVVKDIPKTAISDLKGFKGPGGKTYASYEEMLNEQVAAYNNVLLQAKSVPSEGKIDEYLKLYAEQEMPKNIFSFLTRNVRRLAKGETAESLQDKLNRSTEENLKSPFFAKYSEFGAELDAYNTHFKNEFYDTIKERSKGKFDDARRIIDKQEVTFKYQNVTGIDPDNPNIKTTSVVAVPEIKTSFADGKIEAKQGEAVKITSGEDLVVLFNAPIQNTINELLSDVGRKEWFNYVNENKKAVALNVFGELSKFVQTDEKNEFFKPDLNINSVFESLGTNSDFLEMTRVYASSPDISGMTPEEAEKAIAQRRKEQQEHLTRFLEIVRDNFSNMITAAGQLRTENPTP